jgi:hypothetical protein
MLGTHPDAFSVHLSDYCKPHNSNDFTSIGFLKEDACGHLLLAPFTEEVMLAAVSKQDNKLTVRFSRLTSVPPEVISTIGVSPSACLDTNLAAAAITSAYGDGAGSAAKNASNLSEAQCDRK